MKFLILLPQNANNLFFQPCFTQVYMIIKFMFLVLSKLFVKLLQYKRKRRRTCEREGGDDPSVPVFRILYLLDTKVNL